MVQSIIHAKALNGHNLFPLHGDAQGEALAALPSKAINDQHRASLLSTHLGLPLLSDTIITICDTRIAVSLTRGIWQFTANSVATSNIAEAIPEVLDERPRPVIDEPPP